jgi:isoleucyl-tRNA synthetase
MPESYIPEKIETEIISYWETQDIYKKAKNKAKKGKNYYFLDGPPYTSGKVHLGTAWNKSLKDCIIRYKRMQGFNVWDRAGYDMHGLPTENATQKKLNLRDKNAIEAFGVSKFIDECRKLCVDNLELMNQDFKRLGVWMDFENAYQSVKKEFMEAEWWLIKKAHEKGRLYEGLRTMTWCPISESSLAKHELEYKTVKDTSIFVKFKVKEKKNEYLIIWTTTPWTIPFNLAVMANPEVEYVKAKVDDEVWIVAAPLANIFISSVANKKFEIVGRLQGEELEGLEYIHPFYNELKQHYEKIKSKAPKTHTVLLSDEFVDTSSGSGLVHCAPGCGPEDYEVGHRNGIPPFNNIDTKGMFPKEMGKFAGLIAKKDDAKFIKALEEEGAIIAETEVEHEYPHDWRHQNPVIFRTTKQWFFKIEDLKDEMIGFNEKIKWNPEAAYNAFDSWLKNLRDNSISKQRFWGTPVPVWRNVENDKDYIVIGSARELEELSGETIDDLHIPTVDSIEIKKDGKTYRRIPDILDVWVDAGTVSWSCLGYPQEEQDFKKFFPAEFILEGKDQIRGWFNLLMVASTIAFNKPSFKNVYMHGFVQDSLGRKMSKSLGNYILPEEVIKQFGADTFRYYFIGGSNPGIDINYNPEDIKLKNKNLMILWNIHNFIIDLCQTSDLKPGQLKIEELGLEERYILSKLNSAVENITELFDTYRLNEVPSVIEELYLELSRTYMQLVREKSSVGIKEEKEIVVSTIYHVLLELLKMFTTIAPFISEKIYLDLRKEFKLHEDSISFFSWPKADKKLIDKKLEKEFIVAKSAIQSILSEREKAQIGVRWPLAKVEITVKTKEEKDSIERLAEIIMAQTNIKEVVVDLGEPKVVLDTKIDEDLEAEGFTREVTRRIQALRKTAGLKKDEDIHLHIKCSGKLRVCLEKYNAYLKDKCGICNLYISQEAPKEKLQNEKKEKVKDEEFELHFNKEK